MAILATPGGEALQGHPQLRTCRAPLQMCLPRTISPPVKLNPQELKASLAGRLVPMEGQDSGLRGCQGQPEFLQAWPQGRLEPFRLHFGLKRAAVVIRVSEQTRFSPTLRFDHVLNPQVEHVVQVHVGHPG